MSLTRVALLSNLALALLIAGDVRRAAAVSVRAAAMAPGETHIQRVQRVCAAVASQQFARPQNEAEINTIAQALGRSYGSHLNQA